MASKSLGTLTLDLIAKTGAFTGPLDKKSQAIQSGMFEDVATLLGMANHLNVKGVRTARGNEFAPMTVKRVVERLGLTFP
ncbi:hypothetical protein D3C84_958630 [compost metagenome]